MRIQGLLHREEHGIYCEDNLKKISVAYWESDSLLSLKLLPPAFILIGHYNGAVDMQICSSPASDFDRRNYA